MTMQLRPSWANTTVNGVWTCRVSLLPYEVLEECIALTFGNEGFMAEEYHRAWWHETKAESYQVRGEDGRLLGHSLVFSDPDGWDDDEPTAYFYVSEGARRQGIGSKLRKAVYEDHPKHMVCPHDFVSRNFFGVTEYGQQPIC